MRPQIEERFDPLEKRDVGTKHAFPVGTDEYLVCKINKYVIPIMGGGSCLAHSIDVQLFRSYMELHGNLRVFGMLPGAGILYGIRFYHAEERTDFKP